MDEETLLQKGRDYSETFTIEGDSYTAYSNIAFDHEVYVDGEFSRELEEHERPIFPTTVLSDGEFDEGDDLAEKVNDEIIEFTLKISQAYEKADSREELKELTGVDLVERQ